MDLLKAIAILGVIIIHTCQYDFAPLSFPWLSSVFWGSLTRASVPLFLMCSGALFLSQDRPFSSKKLFMKNIPRILAAMVVWGMAYKVFHLLSGGVSAASLFQALKEVLVLNQEFHFYYLHIILLVYLFLPVMRLIADHATQRQLQYLLLLWFAFGILYPTVRDFWPFRLFVGMSPEYKINMTYASIGYGVLGHYLKRYPPRRPRAGLVEALCGFALTFGGTVALSARDGALNTLFLQGMTVGVALLGAGIFRLCAAARPPRSNRLRDGVTFLSKASFCVYLCHVFFNHLLPQLGFSAALFPPAVGIPLVACVTLALSLLVYLLLSHIPVVKTWLI